MTLDLPNGTAIRSRTYVTMSGKFPRGHKGSFVGTMGDGAEIGLSGAITDRSLVVGNLASAPAVDMCDRYKRIIIPGAAAASVLYLGQIAAYTSGTSVTLSPALGTTVSGVSGTVFDLMTNDGVHPFNPAQT
ncbi:hypothetical protein [Arthrobacter sp. ISL-95]|uniref:hypothetical protein n=1 Tax=Arthrobacter sp. ISL-95 TaxID=2819116 RepID=UPI001BE56F61|nr:hypothetical protein [Arthrobacter sp. ISL-95]MBT2585624.1 hypothetical protein [Arthrobacter sp. ISL-95]